MIGPVVELLGYLLIPMFWASGVLSIEYLMAFVAVSFAFGVVISVGALAPLARGNPSFGGSNAREISSFLP